MIFVAVETQKFPLNRLLRQIDDLVDEGVLREPVFAQTGHSDYIPRNYRYEKFMNMEEYEKAVAQCDLLVTHSGAGTIMAGLRNKKPVIVYPRLAKFGEHVDDHQLEIAKSFSEMDLVVFCAEDDSLGDSIAYTKTHVFARYQSGRDKVAETIRTWLNGV